jgi:hypothetical protein
MAAPRISHLADADLSPPAEAALEVPEWITIPEAALLTGMPIDELERRVERGALFGWPLRTGREGNGPIVVSSRELARQGLLVPDGRRAWPRAFVPEPDAAPHTPRTAARERGQRPDYVRMLQVALGLVWLLDGVLQLQPFMFTKAFVTQVILASADGQPAIIARPLVWAGHLMAPHIALWNALFAAIQIAIGLGLLWRRTVKPALLVSFAWALGVWWFGEGLGGLATGAATMLTGAPGAVILYAVVGLVVWPRESDESVTGLLGETGVRVAWCALWVGAAILAVLPAQRAPGAISSILSDNASGAPGLLASVERTLAHATAGRGAEISMALALLQAAIGVGVLVGRRARLFLLLGIGLSLVFWAVGQNFGDVFSGSSTDPDAGPIYVLLALATLPTVSGAWRPIIATNREIATYARGRLSKNFAT